MTQSPAYGRSERVGTYSSSVRRNPLIKSDGPGELLSSPQSARTVGSAFSSDTWNITPRAHHAPSTPLSQVGSTRKRPGTPAAEYMRWGTDTPVSPSRDFEHVAIQPGEADFDFEIHDDLVKGDGFDGLENVRTCCNGAHIVRFSCIGTLGAVNVPEIDRQASR